MKKAKMGDALFAPPDRGEPATEYAAFQADNLKVFEHFNTINYGKKGGLVSLGKAAWPSQQSLEHHIRQIQALNLFVSIKTGVDRLERPRAWEHIGLWDNKHVPTFERAINKLVNHPKGLRVLCNEIEALFPDHGITIDPVKSICGKARREGCTAWLLGHDLDTAMFKGNTEVAVVAHDEKAVQNIFRSLKRYYGLWPEEKHFAKPMELANSRTLLEFNNGSKLATYTAGGGDIRSFQLDIVHLSEYAHYSDMSAVTSMLTAIPPHCWVFKESTANGRQGPFFEDWQGARTPIEVAQAYDREDANFFQEWNGLYKWFYSWLDDPRYTEKVHDWERANLESTRDDYEKALAERFPDKFTIERLKWRRTKIRSGECQDQELPPEQFFAQEYPADEDEMFQVTGTMPFPSAKLDPMEQRAKANQPIMSLWLDPFEMPKVMARAQANTHIWEPPHPDAMYIVGVDVAQGLGTRGDASYISVLRRIDGVARRQVAAFWSKTTDAKELGHIVAILARWYNDAYTIIETGGGGQLTAMTLYEENGYHNIFHASQLGRISADNGNSFFLGFNTTGKSKNPLIEDLIWATKQGLIEVADPKAIMEMRIFTKKEGKFSAPDGKNDDRVVALALANFADNPNLGAPRLNSQRARGGGRPAASITPVGIPLERSPHTQAYLAAIARMKDKAEKRVKRPAHKWFDP